MQSIFSILSEAIALAALQRPAPRPWRDDEAERAEAALRRRAPESTGHGGHVGIPPRLGTTRGW